MVRGSACVTWHGEGGRGQAESSLLGHLVVELPPLGLGRKERHLCRECDLSEQVGGPPVL